MAYNRHWMWKEFLLGVLLVIATTIVHAGGTVVALRALKPRSWAAHPHLLRTLLICSLVLGMFLLSLLEAALWGCTYVAVGAIESLESALYFSLVTFTTLGYGDMTFESDWRLLASLEAVNGIIMFGWTTALVVAYLQRLAREL